MRSWFHRLKEEYGSELKTLGRLAGPVSLTYFLSFSLNIVNLVVVGHVGASALAAAALGSMFANACGYSIVFGTAGACDTLQSQAFGAGNLPRVGAITMRGILILLLL
jgi:MATE family multidrug resistance protein